MNKKKLQRRLKLANNMLARAEREAGILQEHNDELKVENAQLRVDLNYMERVDHIMDGETDSGNLQLVGVVTTPRGESKLYADTYAEDVKYMLMRDHGISQ